MSLLTAVLFLITSTTTHLEGVLSTILLPYIKCLLSTWLTHKTIAQNDGSHSSIEIPSFQYHQECVRMNEIVFDQTLLIGITMDSAVLFISSNLFIT